MENCILVTIGAHFVSEAEEFFNFRFFCGMVIGVHLMGLLVKAIFYRYHHPWMSLSPTKKLLGFWLKIIFVILGLLALGSLPVLGYCLSRYMEKTSTTSIVLYILTALITLFVSKNVIIFIDCFKQTFLFFQRCCYYLCIGNPTYPDVVRERNK